MQPEKKLPQTPEEERIASEKYANALAQMAALDYKLEQRQTQNQKKPLISKKKVFYIAATVITTIISLLISPLNPLGSNDANTTAPINTDTTQQLIDTTQMLQDANQ